MHDIYIIAYRRAIRIFPRTIMWEYYFFLLYKYQLLIMSIRRSGGGGRCVIIDYIAKCARPRFAWRLRRWALNGLFFFSLITTRRLLYMMYTYMYIQTLGLFIRARAYMLVCINNPRERASLKRSATIKALVRVCARVNNWHDGKRLFSVLIA